MWARVIEFTICCWLAMSRFIFAYPNDATFFWVGDLILSFLIAFFALISLYEPLRKMHLCNLLASFYMIFLSYFFRESDYSHLLQNYMVLGLLLFMIAIIPTNATKPPKPWGDYFR